MIHSVYALNLLLLLGCAASPKSSMSPNQNPADPSSPLSQADEKFLRDLAETRSFTLGKAHSFAITPDGPWVLFLRAEPHKPRQHLYAMEVVSGQIRELIT